MNKRMSQNVWEPDLEISKEIMDRRIITRTNFLGWQHTVRLILEREIPFNTLKVAEVGCGTGTLSLLFSLMGAFITLIDFNQKVLDKAKDIYSLYGCEAEFIKADCMQPPPDDLKGKFDLVISSGLAEHFIGKDRVRCIRYHRLLLKKGGFVCIGVPNKYSPFYQWIRLFRKFTGTWELAIEVPFSANELRLLARKAGFKEAYVIGNAPLTKDLLDYSLGFGSAVKQLLPIALQEKLKSKKREKKVQPEISCDIKRYCNDIVNLIRQDFFKRPLSPFVNNFSAGIYLFAFN